MGLSFSAIVTIIVVLYLFSSIKVLAEYERGVIFRLGRLLGHEKGPGIVLVLRPLTAWSGSRCGRKRWKSLRRTSSPAITSP